MRKLLVFLKDDSAVTAIEYAFVTAGISAAIFATVKSMGANLLK